MKTILVATIFGIILFAASASTSWYLLNQQKILEAQNAPEEADGPLPDETEAPQDDQPTKDPGPLEQMPVALRPDVPMTVDAVLELSRSIQEKEKKLLERERLVRENERRVQMLFEDLKTRHNELLAFETQLESKLAKAEETLEVMRLEAERLQSQQPTAPGPQAVSTNATSEPETDPLDEKVQAIQEWFSKLKAEQAATYLTELSNRGDLDLAARLLNTVSERNIPKILSAVQNKTLEMQLLDELMALKK